MNWGQLIFALTLLAIGAVFIAFNAMIFWLEVVRKRAAPSVAPLVGGFIAAAGIAAWPAEGAWTWAWVPLVVDWGGLRLLLWHMLSSAWLRHARARQGEAAEVSACLDQDAALRVAAAHVAGVRLDEPDYRMGFEFCGVLGDGWLFAYRVHCLNPLPEEARECFAGAGGFIVSATGALRVLAVPEFIEVQRRLG